MSRIALNRRRFLKLVGATPFTYPFLRGVPSYAAGNNGGTNPTYLVLLFTPNGCVRYRWGAQGAEPAQGATAAVVTNGLTFRQTLSAFTKATGPSGTADLTKYVTVLDGLINKAAGAGTHEPGMAALWTGLKADGGGSIAANKGPSIDQAIASQLTTKTAFPSVGMIVQSTQDFWQSRGVDNRMLYDLNGNLSDPIATSPAATVTQLFGPAMPTMSSGPSKKDFIRQQVYNHINADLTALSGRLCNEDKAQLQNLQALWNQILAQLAAAEAQAMSCMRPTTTSAVDAGAGGTNADPFPQYAAVMPNILALTLACNLTRVASLQYSQALSPITHSWLGSSQTDTHHNYSHQGPTSIGALIGYSYPPPPNPDLYMASSVTSQYPQQLIDIEDWYAQQVANLAYTFSQLKTSGTGSLLDQSVIAWGSEIDMGAAHNHDDTPFVLIGGANGQLKAPQNGGQLVRFPLNLSGPSLNNNGVGIRSHNDLLVTLAQLMGVGTDGLAKAYGPSAWSVFNGYVSGPITEILA